MMEMNPASPVFQRIFSNPFAYTAFKSTEPWLQVGARGGRAAASVPLSHSTPPSSPWPPLLP